MLKINIKPPAGAVEILKILNNNGHQAFFVGGCVRDAVLGLCPKDWDITTSALPEEVELLFPNNFPSGKEFGTISVVADEIYEVTTFRTESQHDGRKAVVQFTDSLLDDLSRRDFTCNSLAADLSGNVVDPFNGIEDIKNGVIRAVGNPADRFKEDSLRVLRAVRFAARFGFEIEAKTKDALRVDISNLSGERVRVELCKILEASKPSKYIALLMKKGLLSQIVPEIKACDGFDQKNPHHTKDVFSHILDVVDGSDSLIVKLAALFHDAGKPQTFSIDENGVGHFFGHAKVSAEIAQKAMRNLHFSNCEIDKVRQLVEYHMNFSDFSEKAARRLIAKVGENFKELIELQIADDLACDGARVSSLEGFAILCSKVIADKQAVSVKDLVVNGHDLLSIGKKGKQIGDTLSILLQMVIDDPSLNNKDILLSLAQKD